MTLTVFSYLMVCPLVFLAGFVDSVAGGGGVISLPAYFLAGVPTYLAAGTNKMVACLGTGVSTSHYIRNGKVKLNSALVSAVGALVGGSVGANLALGISEDVLRGVILAVLPLVAVFLTVKSRFGAEGTQRVFSPMANAALSLAIGLAIGVYDGLIGPGTGTFLILAYTAVLGTDLLVSSGCAKIANLASNFASLVVFILHGKVLYALAIPAALFCMLGNYAGARYAIRGGSQNVRKLMFVVLGLLFLKFGLELCGIRLN